MNLHLIAIPFSGVGLHGGYRSDTWYRHRIDIFKNYTLKSLQNQENKDFLLWIWLRPEERTNPITKILVDILTESKVKFVISYDGLLYHDDKFTTYTFKQKMRNLVQMLWDGYKTKEWKPLKQVWKYTWENKNRTLVFRLTLALSELKQVVGPSYDWVYLTRLDSDDMLHQEASNLIQSRVPGFKKALVMDKGFMYNTVTEQLAEWLPPTNPPFHTIIFPGYIFFEAQSHREYYGKFKSHEDIPKVFACETLDLYKYCVTAHGTDHISTAWDVPLAKRAYQWWKYAPYMYTTSGRNISTHWQSHTTKKRNMMLGEEITETAKIKEILETFGLGTTNPSL